MKIRCRSIMASESDGNYDISFKKNGTTYYIELLSDGGNYVAKWWDSSDNGLGYNNKGWVAIEGKNYRALNNIEDVNSDNVVDLLSVISDYDRKPGKPIQDRIKREVAKLVDFDAINSGCTKKSVKASRKPIKAATDISNPYIRIFLTNLGKYNEGELVGEWVDLPVTDFDGVLERIGINDQYEEYFITDYETNIPNLSIGEYDSLDELNNMASQIDSLDESQILIMSARLYNGESFEDALAGCDDGSIYYDCYSDQDLGYEIIDQIGGTEQLDKDTLEMYFDYDGYGRDIRINGSFIEIEPGTLVELY